MSKQLLKYIITKSCLRSRIHNMKYMSTVNNEKLIKVTFNKANGDKITAEGKKGDSLLDVIINNNLDFDGYGACEGTLTCSTCHVILDPKDYDALPEKPSDEELDMLDLAYNLTDTSRLGCQIILEEKLDGLEVKVPATVNDARQLGKMFQTIIGNVGNKRIVIITDLRPSLDVILGKKYPHLVNSKLEHSFYFVHRLDFVTSGLLCIALNKRACAKASSAMQKRISQKYYIALVRGHVSKDHLDLTNPIGYCAKEVDGNRKMCNVDEECCTEPRDALTRLVVLERGVYMSYPATKVLLQLVTGRRHQIRVHCSTIGHTIVGDYTYSGRKDTSPHRTFLHSYRLELGVDGINVQTNDPFTEAKLNGLWIPVEYVNKAEDDCFRLFSRYS
ncbi:hypothetical protein AGLY_016207 [Aphis glycines]|uniref:2Fe-2S ferredoxin-type domain-containing protein n=1 Tax=Aphis glycines TaxID=307491 RepID=A0A6G0SZX9_APHGL|nr:hypothetical protein AGLY_016207 [Aphis glycines]